MNKKDHIVILMMTFLVGLLSIALYLTFFKDLFLYFGIGIIVLEIIYLYYLYKNSRNYSSSHIYSKSRVNAHQANVEVKKKSNKLTKKYVTINHIATKLKISAYDVLSLMSKSNMGFPSNIDYLTKIEETLAVGFIRQINNVKVIQVRKINKEISQVSYKNELENRQWNIMEISEHLNMSMYDVRNFVINQSHMGFEDLTYFSKIEYDRALELTRKLKKYKNENIHEISRNASKIIEVPAPKKKTKPFPTTNTTIKAISAELNIPIQEVIDYAYKSKMGFKNLNAETKINKPQAIGLIKKIKKFKN